MELEKYFNDLLKQDNIKNIEVNNVWLVYTLDEPQWIYIQYSDNNYEYIESFEDFNYMKIYNALKERLANRNSKICIDDWDKNSLLRYLYNRWYQNDCNMVFIETKEEKEDFENETNYNMSDFDNCWADLNKHNLDSALELWYEDDEEKIIDYSITVYAGFGCEFKKRKEVK